MLRKCDDLIQEIVIAERNYTCEALNVSRRGIEAQAFSIDDLFGVLESFVWYNELATLSNLRYGTDLLFSMEKGSV
jgi:hypothetical protein